MQVFTCPTCASRVYFDNLTCPCGTPLIFDPEAQVMRADGQFCPNRTIIGCNWMAVDGGLCRSCAMTVTVPDLGEPDNIDLWARTAAAKRWMLANLGRWGWFTDGDPGPRPVFRLLSERTATGTAAVIMGHASGTITINVVEASDVVRQERQKDLGELYRTMLGHMRHEIAHFLHDRLLGTPGFAAAFRALFGDERTDYAAALDRHYAAPKPADADHITGYATAHPHEDWAETTAHLLHLVDLRDSAMAVGLVPPGTDGPDSYTDGDAERLLTCAVDTALAINHVNRSVHLPDLYPFVLGAGARRKLAFAHGWLRLNTGVQSDRAA